MAGTYRIKCCVIHTVCKYFEENFLLANICCAYPIYVNFGAPLHYLVLKSAYIRNKIAQIVQNKPTFAFSMQKRHRLGKNTPSPVVVVVTNMSYAVVEYFCRAHIFFSGVSRYLWKQILFIVCKHFEQTILKCKHHKSCKYFLFWRQIPIEVDALLCANNVLCKNVLCNYISFPMPDTH